VRSQLSRLEFERTGIHAIPQPGRRRAVVEHVAQVTAAAAAQHFRALHEQTAVLTELDVLGDRGLVEARPAGAGVKLRARVEQLGATARAVVGAVIFGVDILAGERRFGSLPAQHVVLIGRQSLAPLFFCQLMRLHTYKVSGGKLSIR
jgi:hypothetical protein